jgi:hypothetical protein
VRVKDWVAGVDVVWHGGDDGLEYGVVSGAGVGVETRGSSPPRSREPIESMWPKMIGRDRYGGGSARSGNADGVVQAGQSQHAVRHQITE